MKRRLIWILELFIWLFILFLLAGGIMLAKYNYKKVFNTYQIFLHDVDGLINGSPVKFMGIQVGYVNQIDIVGEDIYVRFIITKPDIRIPHGSAATVEFSGLGGSKSLEIYPPKKKDISYADKLITPLPPKRIHDSLGLLNDMFDKAMILAYEVSHFMNQVGIIKNDAKTSTTEKPKSINEVLDSTNNWLDSTQKQSDKFSKKLKDIKDKKNGKEQDKTDK